MCSFEAVLKRDRNFSGKHGDDHAADSQGPIVDAGAIRDKLSCLQQFFTGIHDRNGFRAFLIKRNKHS